MCKILSLANLNAIKSIKIAKKDKKFLFICVCVPKFYHFVALCVCM